MKRLKRREDTRCPVADCKFNLGDRGTLCDYTLHGRPCRHPVHRETWVMLTEATKAATDPVIRPVTLTARATAASKPLSAERARQLALELEV